MSGAGISALTLWAAILGMAAVTQALRASFLVLPAGLRLPEPLRRALRYVPAAVLTAIWAPELLLSKGSLYLTFENARLLAGVAAIAVAWRLRLTFVTIVSGLTALHLAEWLLART
ncbi:MAG: AzlD domain-containing protein [Pseudomonadota bacterium]